MVKGKRNDVNLQCINILHHNLTNPNQKPTLHCCLLSCIFPAKKIMRHKGGEKASMSSCAYLRQTWCMSDYLKINRLVL